VEDFHRGLGESLHLPLGELLPQGAGGGLAAETQAVGGGLEALRVGVVALGDDDAFTLEPAQRLDGGLAVELGAVVEAAAVAADDAVADLLEEIRSLAFFQPKVRRTT